MELFVTSFEIEKVVETLRDINAPLKQNHNGFKINVQEAIGSCSR